VVPMATSLGHVRAGSVRALAIGGSKRSAALPDTPTVAESGLPGFESTSWQGWFVPAGTPREVVGIIQRAAAKALTAPDLIERLRVGGNEGVGSTPEEFEARFKADLAKFAKIVKDAHIPMQD
jgi:tripartite-type tricarboxylate transporter receptor subunit TctC